MLTDQSVYQWLLEGDPSIRWQVMRDLLGEDNDSFNAERNKISLQGWGAKLLSYQESSGRWAGQLYSHKWLSTTYTLRLLRHMGLDPKSPQAQRACRELLDGGFQSQGGISYAKTKSIIDNGVTGMVLAILAYWKYPDSRLHRIADYLVSQQMSDGRWEPYPANLHLKYTFDTTLLILDGLYEYSRNYLTNTKDLDAIRKKGHEFLLDYRLYQDHNGAAIDSKITLFSFPPYWHCDVLVALDYFQASRVGRDERFKEAIDLLIRKRNPDGSWNLQNRHAGKTYFDMEAISKPSRWNTLRALRVLKWWAETPSILPT